MRKKLPLSTERQILIRNRHCCCICQSGGLGQEPVIHHIDGNNSNNEPANLAVLCLVHASMADAGLKKGKLGSGKKLKPEEVREYKKIWERKIELESKYQKHLIPTIRKRELEILYRFEIGKTKNEILSLKDDDKRVKEKFNYLDELVIEEFRSGLKIRRILLNAYSDLAYFCFGDIQRPKRLATSLWGLFLHLIGPDYVKMHDDDKKIFLTSLSVFDTLGDFVAEFNDKSVLRKVCNEIFNLYEIATWYKFKKGRNKIPTILSGIRKSCSKFENGKGKRQLIGERKEREKIVDKVLLDIRKLK